jgi:4-amino-4-deoxy-L-arabinose transferase-like glycosyltransferase
MKFKPYAGLLIVILIAAIPLFGHLDSAPLYIWDEARLAHSALEMNNTHNWIVTTIDGLPDMWNTKPPLLIWIQALLISLLGTGELAIRLPSALAALGVAIMLYVFLTRKFKAPLSGIITVAVLVTSHGFVAVHGTRTGDYDSLLTLFMTGYALSFYLFLEEEKRKYLYWFFFLLTLACLTKGIQSVMFLPPLFIYAAYKKKVLLVLKQKHTYIGIACFLVFGVGYYFLREHYNPGYIKAVMQNEIGGRYNGVIENHTGDGWFYLEYLTGIQFSEWYLLILPGFFLGLFSSDMRLKNLSVFSFTLALTYFLILMGGKTKIYWYTMPVIPFLSILVAVFLFSICKIFSGFTNWKSILSHYGSPAFSRWFSYVFLVLIIFMPYFKMYTFALAVDIVYPGPAEKMYMEMFLKDVLHHEKNIDGTSLLIDGLGEQDMKWYLSAFSYGHRPNKFVTKPEIDPNGKIVAYLAESKKFIDSSFNTQILDTFYNVTTYKLNGRK